jgi:predicted transposase YdaD
MGRDRHDRLFKETFSEVRNLAVELRAALPPGLVELVDFSTLHREPVDFQVPGMAPIEGDLLVSAELLGERALFWILTEHQSTVDALMPLRFYGYCYGAWTEYARNRRGQELPVLPLPVIIPVLVHHSETGWTAARSFHELFDPALVGHPDVARHLPGFEFVLDDLSRLSAGEIVSRARNQAEQAAVLVLFALRFGRDPLTFFRRLMESSEFVVSVTASPAGSDAFRAVLDYLEGTRDAADLLDELRRAVGESHASLEAKEAVMSIAEQLRSQGRIEGRVEGRLEGERSLLTLQVTQKFGEPPEWARMAIEAASDAQLRVWASRILVAASLEELLRA